jgi:hypothetical protein
MIWCKIPRLSPRETFPFDSVCRHKHATQFPVGNRETELIDLLCEASMINAATNCGDVDKHSLWLETSNTRTLSCDMIFLRQTNCVIGFSKLPSEHYQAKKPSPWVNRTAKVAKKAAFRLLKQNENSTMLTSHYMSQNLTCVYYKIL